MHDIEFDVYIKASPEQVYRAVSDSTILIDWWPKTCIGVPKKGSEYNFFFEEPYDWYGTCIKAKENESFYIRITKSDEDWDNTIFGYQFDIHKEGTMVSFSHKGWKENNHHYRNSSYCWAVLLKGLKNLLEKGEKLPFEKRG